MLLSELFDTKTEYQWDHKLGNIVARFKVDNINYIVNFVPEWMEYFQRFGKGINIEFAIIDSNANNNYGISNTRNEFKIFSIIIDIIKEYINKHNPDYITFEAKEPSRIKLYNALCKRFSGSKCRDVSDKLLDSDDYNETIGKWYLVLLK